MKAMDSVLLLQGARTPMRFMHVIQHDARALTFWHAVESHKGSPMMNLGQLSILVERLRKEAIGEPKFITEKRVYEYQDNSAKVVAVLKIVRAAQGVHTLDLLCRSGMFIDFGIIIRCVVDCEAEVYFLLENFPNTSGKVDKFVKAFFASSIDGYLSNETRVVYRLKKFGTQWCVF
jgi:hypothetical protein